MTTTVAMPDSDIQSLATGATGAALTDIEVALHDRSGWPAVHARLAAISAAPIDAGLHAGLYYGAPALRYLLACASQDGRGRYRSAADALDRHVVRIVTARLADAHQRHQAAEPTRFAEYDLFYGLVGLGTLLARTDPDSGLLADVLAYVVSLTTPRREPAGWVPGWFVPHDPDPLLPTPGGHANLGLAHGAAGLLAFLASSARAGHLVDGQWEAITGLQQFFDDWRQDSDTGPWWPQWLTPEELATSTTNQLAPGRPSWCYGTAGVGRALHLAALATGDQQRRHDAETALRATVHPANAATITDAGLCHGAAGILHVLTRAAADSPILAADIPQAMALLDSHAAHYDGDGLLNGTAGIALASIPNPRSRWDTCLLTS